MYTLTYTYTRSLLRQYFRHELWRTQGSYLVAWLILIVAGAAASMTHDYQWFAGFVAGIGFFYVLAVYGSYRRLDLFPVDVPMKVTLSDSGIHFQSTLVTSETPWAAIRATRRTPAGLAITSRITRRPVLLPSTAITEEIIAYVEQQVKQGGGKS